MSTHTDNWHDLVFFGIHYDLHANAQDTELGREVTAELLREAWQKIRPDWIQCDCKGHPGYTSWPTQVGTPSPGIVRDALRIHRDVTRELGIPLVVHYSGVWDTVAMQQHPEWARVNADGQRDPDKACLTGGYGPELMVPQLLEIIDRYDVDGFWVDGENWATAPCYCERCQRQFADQAGGPVAPRGPAEPGWQAWLAFQRRAFDAHVYRYTAAIHQRKPGCLVCSNWMYSLRQPEPVTVPVDFLSGDFSHAWGLERALVEARFLASRGMPWDLMAWGFTTGENQQDGWQFKTADHLCQEVAEVVANGGAVCVYVHPPRSGHLIGWQHDILAEVAQFCRARQAAAQGSVSVPQAVVLHSQSHYYAHNTPLYNPGQATQPLEGALQALLDTGYHADVQNEEGLLSRLGEYGLVVVAEQEPVPEAVAAALQAYVESGGRLVLSGAGVARQPTLARLAGVEAVGVPRTGFHYLPVGSAAVTVAGPWQPVALRGAREWARLLAVPEPAQAGVGTAISLREVGNGRVAVIHGPVFAAYFRTHYPLLRVLLRSLFHEVWPDPLAELEAAGAVVHTVRRQPGRTVVHILNRGVTPATSPRNVSVERVPAVGPVTLRLRLAERPASVRVVPGGQDLDWIWDGGVVSVKLPQVHIHAAVVVEE
ncbi:MAG TPA: alpha-amylase family protein [Chloroflexota bacterium]